MATPAPNTGASTRAPAIDQRSVSDQASDAQGLLDRIEAIHFGISAATDEFGATENDRHRFLVNRLTGFADLLLATTREAHAVCEAIELAARRFEPEAN